MSLYFLVPRLEGQKFYANNTGIGGIAMPQAVGGRLLEIQYRNCICLFGITSFYITIKTLYNCKL
jgi:hypothetical protein